MTDGVASGAGQPGGVQGFYCGRCDNPRPLGMVAPGRFWSRWGGRTIIAEGGTVRLWCERCGKENAIDLDAVDKPLT